MFPMGVMAFGPPLVNCSQCGEHFLARGGDVCQSTCGGIVVLPSHMRRWCVCCIEDSFRQEKAQAAQAAQAAQEAEELARRARQEMAARLQAAKSAEQELKKKQEELRKHEEYKKATEEKAKAEAAAKAAADAKAKKLALRNSLQSFGVVDTDSESSDDGEILDSFLNWNDET
jgi:hypothetical protein